MLHLVRVVRRSLRHGPASGAVVLAMVLAGAVVPISPAAGTTVAAGAVATADAATEPAPVTYAGPAFAPGASPSADKPQSKLWYHDGTWWAIMRTPGNRVTVHALSAAQTWRDTGVLVDERGAATGDALWEGGHLYVASVTTGGSRVNRLTYDAAARTYVRDPGFPVSISSSASESVTIARDSTGRLWATWTAGSRVTVAHSTTSDAVWSAPFVVPVADNVISSDDISAVVAFSGKIGIMWSDQQSGAFRFAVHEDGAPVGTWSLETPLSGPRIADDHINLKSMLADDQGRIHAAVKTSLSDSDPAPTTESLLVLSRTASGTWTSAVATRHGDGLTRPQLALDRTSKTLYFLASREGGGSVYYKRTPLSSISFPAGRGDVFIQWDGASINNVATAKDPVDATTGLVALATDSQRYYHGVLDLGGGSPPAPGDTTPPTAPTGLGVTGVTSTSVSLQWQASSDASGVTGYRVLRGSTPVATVTGTSATDTGLTPDTAYSYTVVAQDAAGNTSPPSGAVGARTAASTLPASGTAALRSSSTATNNTSTELVLPRPATIAPGDLLLAGVTTRGAPTITPPAGWTLVRLDINANTGRQALYSRTATDTEPGTYTFALSRSAAAVGEVLAYGGVSGIAAHAGQVNTTSTTTATAPDVPVTAGQLVVAFFGIARTTTAEPAGPLVERTEITTTAGTSRATAMTADTTATTTGRTGPLTATYVSSSTSWGQTLTLQPAG